MKEKKQLIWILTLGVFAIINTEMGVIGILPMMAEHLHISITQAGLFVSLFALMVAFSGPTMPLFFSGLNRKNMMIAVQSIFLVCNLIMAFSGNFYVAIIARIIPALFHPVYISMAFSVAASSVEEKDAPVAVAKVMMGVSVGMVLGVPVVSFVAGTFSLQIGMLVFALGNAVVLIATILFVPSMEVTEKMTYGQQIRVLKRPVLWISMIAVVFLNGSIFGVYSFLSEYLSVVTGMTEQMSSLILLIYGLANIVGNIIAGKALSVDSRKFVMCFPPVLLLIYICLFYTGSMLPAASALILVWGILAGCAGNINQYWITSVTEEAPDFGNGLFLAATNLGTTIGTSICGWFISALGTASVIIGGIPFLVCSFAMILWRVAKEKKTI